ncbi:MAG: HupE/UreJ family protein [Gammaproteobacteria bacterium]
MNRLGAPLLLLLGIVVGGPAAAHKPSDSYLTLEWDGDRIDGRWDIALRDLDYAIGLDADGDGNLRWGEVKARHAQISAYALSHLTLAKGGSPCPTTAATQQIDIHSDGTYTVLRFAASCPTVGGTLAVGYSLFFNLDPTHHGLLKLRVSGREIAAILTPASPEFLTGADGLSLWSGFFAYVVEGIWHIWIGYDHIAFLLLLLLPVALRRRNGAWEPMPDVRSTGIAILKIVTGFTAAHSITLTLATLQIVVLPAKPVEVGIAISVAAAAVYNLLPIRNDPGYGWRIAFGFGLLHGFGFANVLGDLGLAGVNVAVTLAGFNLGVELGQLSIVAVLMPIIYLVRKRRFYTERLLPGGSIALALLASIWIWQRAMV